MKNFSKIFLFFILLNIVFMVTACGKLASPTPIEGSNYPHSYPRN